MNTERLKIRWAHLFNEEMHKFFVNKNVLDIGCLNGYSTNQFFKHNAKNVVGIDIDPKYVDEAIKNYSNIVFKLQDAEEIDNFKGSPATDNSSKVKSSAECFITLFDEMKKVSK